MITLYNSLELDCPLVPPQQQDLLSTEPPPKKRVSKKRIPRTVKTESSTRSHVDPRLRKEQLRVESLKKRVQNTPSMLASSIEFMTVQHHVSKSRGQQLTRIASKRK